MMLLSPTHGEHPELREQRMKQVVSVTIPTSYVSLFEFGICAHVLTFVPHAPLNQTYSTGPIPPEAGATLVNATGSNGPQFS